MTTNPSICLSCSLFQCEECRTREVACCCGRLPAEWDEPCHGCSATVGDCECEYDDEEAL